MSKKRFVLLNIKVHHKATLKERRKRQADKLNRSEIPKIDIAVDGILVYDERVWQITGKSNRVVNK